MWNISDGPTCAITSTGKVDSSFDMTVLSMLKTSWYIPYPLHTRSIECDIYWCEIEIAHHFMSPQESQIKTLDEKSL